MGDNNDNNDLSKNFKFYCIVAFVMSSLSSIILNLLLRKKKSNYSKLMRYICLSEAIYIYCEFIMILTYQDKSNHLEGFFSTATKGIFFNAFDEGSWSKFMANLNRGFYFSNQTFSLLINNFICLETITTLRNPISPVRKRLKIYFFLTFFCSIIVFCVTLFSGVDYLIANKGKLTLPEYLFYNEYVMIFNNLVFSVFVFIGVLSFLYLINRFCIRKNVASNLRNKFVLRHFIYYITYISTLVLYYAFSIRYIINRDLDQNNSNMFSASIVLHLSLGFIMFLIRASETRFYNYIFFCVKRNSNSNNNYISASASTNENKTTQGEITEGFLDPDQPMTVMISKTLNLEFMCCVLYGFSTIFRKNEKKSKSSEDSTNLIPMNSSLSNNQASIPQSPLNSKKGVSRKDYKMFKSHLIFYNKIYEEFDLNDIKMEVKKKKDSERNVNSSSHCESSSNLTDLNVELYKKQDALIIEYCPRIFRELREIDDISNKELEDSFDPKLNRANMERIKEGEGKSGSFFFFSHDGKFLIKTMTSSELNTFLGDFVVSYHEHMMTNPDTILAKIYGVYTVIINNISKINVVLMQNLLIFPKSHIKRIFDLKGSKVDRFTKNIEKVDKFKTLKDLDYEWMTKVDPELINFTKHVCIELDSVLQNDLAMLRSVNIMDYSLMLIVIHFPDPDDTEYQNIINVFGEMRYKSRIFKSKNQKYIYCMGIIDYLQKFNMTKFLENKYKSLLYGEEAKYVSAVDPTIYCKRMHDWAKANLFISNGLN